MGQQGGRRSPLHFAGIYRLHEIMSLLLAHGAEVDLLDANGWSALHYVALNGDADAAEILLAAGADPGLSIMQGGGMGETAAAFARRPSPASASRKKRLAIGILDESAHDEVSTVHSPQRPSRFRRGVESM